MKISSRPAGDTLTATSGKNHREQGSDRRAAGESEKGVQWQRELAGAVRSTAELLHRLELTGQDGDVETAEANFPVIVPDSFIRRMRVGDPQDPLLLQVLPVPGETQTLSAETADPVGDLAATVVPGLIQKYHGRALLVMQGTCAVHCRYCFRREFPYDSAPRSLDSWEPAFRHIEQDDSLQEILLSGGDPLTLADQRFSRVLERLDGIPHLERIRIHTRLPIVIPSRVTTALIGMLSRLRTQPVLVVHSNHAAELTGDCAEAMKRLRQLPGPVLNQAVLLRGVNDSVAAQEALCRRLINLGLLPYYLNLLDPARGTAHFDVTEEEGVAIVTALRNRLPGYGVPTLVREIPGRSSKTPVF